MQGEAQTHCRLAHNRRCRDGRSRCIRYAETMTADDEGTGDLLVAYAESTLKSRRLRREVAEIVERLKTLIASLEDDPATVSTRGDAFSVPLKRTQVSFDQLSDLGEKVAELSLVENDLKCAKQRLAGNPLWRAFKPE